MQDQLIPILASLGVIQAVLLALYFATLRTGSRAANILLASVLIGLSIRIGKSIFNHYLSLDPWQRNLGLSGMLMVGPGVWLYAGTLIEKQFQLRAQHGLHYLPAITYIGLSWLIPNTSSISSILSYCFILLHLLTYVSLTAYRLFAEKNDISPEVLLWLVQILIGVGVIWLYYVLVFARIIPYYIGGAVFYSLLVYSFSYLLLKRHRFSLVKYQHSELNTKETALLAAAFIQRMRTEHDYLDRKLSLASAAALIGSSARDLSRAINEHQQCNFSELIATFRIEKAKKILTEPTHQNSKIAVIALECGFGNTTSFNSVFKRATAMTPSQYRKQALSGADSRINKRG